MVQKNYLESTLKASEMRAQLDDLVSSRMELQGLKQHISQQAVCLNNRLTCRFDLISDEYSCLKKFKERSLEEKLLLSRNQRMYEEIQLLELRVEDLKSQNAAAKKEKSQALVAYTEKEVGFRLLEKSVQSSQLDRKKYSESLKVDKDIILQKQTVLEKKTEKKRQLELGIKKLYLVLKDRRAEESQEGIKLDQISSHFVKKLEGELEQKMQKLKDSQSEELRLRQDITVAESTRQKYDQSLDQLLREKKEMLRSISQQEENIERIKRDRDQFESYAEKYRSRILEDDLICERFEQDLKKEDGQLVALEQEFKSQQIELASRLEQNYEEIISNYRQRISQINREVNQTEKKKIELSARIEEKSSAISMLRNEIDAGSYGIHGNSEDNQRLRLASSDLVLKQEKLRQLQRQEELIKESVFHKATMQEEEKKRYLEKELDAIRKETDDYSQQLEDLQISIKSIKQSTDTIVRTESEHNLNRQIAANATASSLELELATLAKRIKKNGKSFSLSEEVHKEQLIELKSLEDEVDEIYSEKIKFSQRHISELKQKYQQMMKMKLRSDPKDRNEIEGPLTFKIYGQLKFIKKK